MRCFLTTFLCAIALAIVGLGVALFVYFAALVLGFVGGTS